MSSSRSNLLEHIWNHFRGKKDEKYYFILTSYLYYLIYFYYSVNYVIFFLNLPTPWGRSRHTYLINPLLVGPKNLESIRREWRWTLFNVFYYSINCVIFFFEFTYTMWDWRRGRHTKLINLLSVGFGIREGTCKINKSVVGWFWICVHSQRYIRDWGRGRHTKLINPLSVNFGIRKGTYKINKLVVSWFWTCVHSQRYIRHDRHTTSSDPDPLCNIVC